MLEAGIRVIRGPDWRWGAQDNGDGHVGTVVEIGKSGSLTTPEKTVVVQWDYGYRTNYRVGYQDGYDLLVVDNAPAGVKHPNIICDECQKLGIAGIRWKCVNCYDYDLCTHCYMADKHDLNHVFQRFTTANSIGVEMPARRYGSKIQLKGIFVGAKVVRGIDWDWGDQDGGEGKTGRVIDIRGWDNESSRSVANVTWTSGSTNVYRMGHKGKVDLKYTQEACGGTFYRQHLPNLGHAEDSEGSQTATNHLTFSVGDKIKVVMDIPALKVMQDGHGGWNQKMADYIGQIGTVHRVTERGDIRVQYDGCSHRWTFHPGALTKVNTFTVGDIVRVLPDLERVKEHQIGHGEWIDVMTNALGKMGKVSKIYSDGDLRVTVEGQTWTLNPLNVKLVPGSATELENTLQSDEEDKQPDPVDSLLPNVVEELGNTNGIDCLVHEAAEGNYNFVRDFLAKFPTKVNEKSSGKTSLQVAAHQGHLEIVNCLLEAGADLEIKDEVGDSALHYTAFGNQPRAMELLILKSANINAENANKCTSLHVAVNKQHVMCVETLLKYRCNINTQDSYGDTALHDAIGKDNTDVLDMLCVAPGVDYTLRNKRGFNVVHHAALKGNNYAAEKLLVRTRQLVDVKKDDGFAAIHLASLNGHRAITETLLVQGQADINLRNNRKQTALLLSVAQSHCGVVELLVSMGANANIADEDGDTSLHLAVIKAVTCTHVEPPSELEAPTIHGILVQLHTQNPALPIGLAAACYLVQEADADLFKKNLKHKTPLDVVPSHLPQYQNIVEVLMKYDKEARKRQSNHPPPRPASLPIPRIPSLKLDSPDTSPTGSENTECTVCSETGKNIVFEPCGDKIVCAECAVRMKRCLQCHQTILRKVSKDGCDVSCKDRPSSSERLKYLESKIAEIEETHCCSICLERRRNVAFLCGHGACESCARTLKTCHMCRKTITKKINLY